MAEEPLLYRKLADIEPTEAAIQEFANKYGCLGIRLPHVGFYSVGNTNVGSGEPSDCIDWEPMILSTKNPDAGEPLWAWLNVIEIIRKLLEMWDQIDDPESFKKSIENLDGVDPERLPKGSALPGGELWVQMISGLLDNLNTQLAFHAAPALLFQESSERPRFFTIPKNLAGVVLLQLARVIDGERIIRKCRECGREFEISQDIGFDRYSEEVRRSNALYCGDKCKLRFYRGRRKQVFELCDKGYTIEDVISETGFGSDIIKTCFSEWKSKGGKGRRKRG